MEQCPSNSLATVDQKNYYLISGSHQFTDGPSLCAAIGTRMGSYTTQEEYNAAYNVMVNHASEFIVT